MSALSPAAQEHQAESGAPPTVPASAEFLVCRFTICKLTVRVISRKSNREFAVNYSDALTSLKLDEGDDLTAKEEMFAELLAIVIEDFEDRN